MVAAGAVEDDLSRRQEVGVRAGDERAVLAARDVEQGDVGVDQARADVPDREQRVPPVGQKPRPPVPLLSGLGVHLRQRNRLAAVGGDGP